MRENIFVKVWAGSLISVVWNQKWIKSCQIKSESMLLLNIYNQKHSMVKYFNKMNIKNSLLPADSTARRISYELIVPDLSRSNCLKMPCKWEKWIWVATILSTRCREGYVTCQFLTNHFLILFHRIRNSTIPSRALPSFWVWSVKANEINQMLINNQMK